MKVLVISNCDLDSNQGSGYVIGGFAGQLRLRGHRVTACEPRDFILFPKKKAAKRLRLFCGYTIQALRCAWLQNQHDIVELWGSLGWLAILILRLRPRRRYLLISRSNGLEPHYRKQCGKPQQGQAWRTALARFETFCDELGFRFADAITVVSGYEEAYAKERAYQKSATLLTLENPLPPHWLGQNLQTASGPFTFGFVGSWLDRKGKSQLISMIHACSNRGSKARWLIVGVGIEGKRELEGAGIENCKVYASVDREGLSKLYRQMTVFISLSSYESFGLVCSEAMACGSLLVATRVGFAAGLQEGVHYVGIDRNDISATADKLCLIEKKWEAFAPIRTAGYQRVQQLDWCTAGERLEQYYITLINRSR